MRHPSKRLRNFVFFVPILGPFLPHFCVFRFVSVDLQLVSVQSKHRKSLFRYRSETTETKILFRIVPKLVSVPVSVVSNRNYFRRTPYSQTFGDLLKGSLEGVNYLLILHGSSQYKRHLNFQSVHVSTCQ
jgi:hypothetical protein